nr:putative ribonuclease H-like domain-containing protein [Tanacetum cinerariifolium]
GNPQQALKDKGVIDSGCSSHMTENISFLSDFEEINGGYVAFVGKPKGFVVGNQPNDHADDDAAFDVKENENDAHVSANGKAKRDDKGKNMPELEDIVYSDDEEDVGAEADLSNLETNIHVSPIPNTRVHKDHHVLVDLPKGKRAIGSRWVFKNKKDERGIVIRNKARLVAQGHTQEEGIEYDEFFAPVSRIKAIQLFLAYASFMGFMVYQMDVKSAFLYETIKEEVYVCQPLGFKDPDYPDKVYKVVKVLYGLHQAPRAWYETLANYLLENGFQRGKIDQTLFIKKQKGDILLGQVYVDDVIFGSTNKELCKAFDKLMKDKFQMSSIGELTFFLGLQVKKKDDRIFISQDKYVPGILRKFRFTDVKSTSTPIDTKKPLLKDPDGEDVDVHIYRFQVTPKVSHLHAVKRIFKYLKGKPHLGLWYPRDSPFNLMAYSDSDYAGASLDRKFLTGVVASCCAQVLWIQNQLLDYGKELASPKQTAIGKDILNPFMASSLPKTICYKLMLFGLMKDAAVNLMLLDFLNAHTIQYALVVNHTIYVSCIKQFWATATIKKVNDVVQLRALIDGKKVVVFEDIIIRDLHLDDAKGVECLPNEEIFVELARMSYEKPPLKLTFYKAFFSTQWKFLIHNLVYIVRNVDNSSKFLMYPRFLQVVMDNQVDDMTSHNTIYTYHALTQKVFANMRRVGKEEREEVEVPNAPAPPSPTNAPSPPPQDPTPTPHASPPQEQPSSPYDSTMPFRTTLIETCASLSQKVAELEQDKHTQTLEILQVKKRVKKLEKKKRSKSSGFKRLRKIEAIDVDEGITLVDVEKDEEVITIDAEPQGWINQEDVNAASKGVSATKPTVFDGEEIAQKLHDEEVQKATARDKQEKDDFERAQVLQKLYDDKEENIDWNAVAEQVQERHLDNIRKYQSLKKKPVSIAQARKNMIMYLKNMVRYKIEHFREIPSNDLKEMSEEDVQNMLEIVPVSEFKVEALQVKYPIIDWEIYTESSGTYWKIIRVGGITKACQSFEDMLKGFDKENLVALWNLVKEKFSSVQQCPVLIKKKLCALSLKDYLNQMQMMHDMFILTEKDYPLSNGDMILMLSGKLQVEEDNEMARDLVMKIFMEANKPKSRSLDTSSK